jgi:hypothetical protein
MTTWTEASTCPRCSRQGEVTNNTATEDTSHRPCIMRTLTCRTPGCSWHNTDWWVTQYPDGTIMEPQGGREKQYEMPEGGQLTISKRVQDANDYAAAMEKLTRGGTELRKQ